MKARILAVLAVCLTPAVLRGADAIVDAPERFIPSEMQVTGGGTLELRSEATITGSEVKLKQICRWDETHAASFGQIGELVVARFDGTAKSRTIALADLRSTMQDARINLGIIDFAGATTCTVKRSDVQARQAVTPTPSQAEKTKPTTINPAPVAAMTPLAVVPATQPTELQQDPKSYSTLHDLLVSDLCSRLKLPAEKVQVQFRPGDLKTLNLSEPFFRFKIEPRRVRDLGEVMWEVTVQSAGGSQHVVINAMALAWQNQLVVVRPMSYRQIVRDEDVIERRSLVDHLGERALLTRPEVVGQQAASSLKPGDVLTARMIEAVPLVKNGQLVTITVNQGSIQVKMVARSMESGTYGQTVRVRNEVTRDTFDVTVTGPQTASLGGTPSRPTPARAVAMGQE